MKQLYKALIALVALYAFTASAKAGVYLEPYVGYAASKATSTVSRGTTSVTGSADYSGVGYGGRAGLKGRIFAVGAEYQAGRLKSESGGKFEPQDIGAFIGVFAPLGFRAYGTYFFSAKAGSYKGTAWKLGIGYQMLMLLSLNLEYIDHDYKAISGSSASTSIKMKVSTYFLSMSVPLSF
jgi:hypothetical protein